jgi:hypothetical protein
LDRELWEFAGGRDGADARAGAQGLALVFLDPPYPLLTQHGVRAKLFESVGELVLHRMRTGGVLVFHAPRRVLAEREFGSGVELDMREYGTTALWYVRRKAGELLQGRPAERDAGGMSRPEAKRSADERRERAGDA